MRIERLVALYVNNEDVYQQYREAMIPILKSYGGGFSYDFKISEVLKSDVEEPINRVFIIYFDNETVMDNFFSDEKYLAIRQQYYLPSVSATTVISKYQY